LACRKDELPDPQPSGIRVLSRKCVWQRGFAMTGAQVEGMYLTHLLQMLL
jgi:hypothetical protein